MMCQSQTGFSEYLHTYLSVTHITHAHIYTETCSRGQETQNHHALMKMKVVKSVAKYDTSLPWNTSI